MISYSKSVYKGIDLLNKILELKDLTSTERWTFDAYRHNQPRFIRLKQINALINAFFYPKLATDVPKNFFTNKNNDIIPKILSGNIFDGQNINDFSEVIEYMATTLKVQREFEFSPEAIEMKELKRLYQKLIQYKIKLHDLLDFNSGLYVAGTAPILFAYCLTNSINMDIAEKSVELDQVLEFLLNPKNSAFTENELIANYNFPEDDLLEIDIDNM